MGIRDGGGGGRERLSFGYLYYNVWLGWSKGDLSWS